MSFGTYISNGFRQLFFDDQATRDIVADENSFRYGVILLAAVAGLASLLFFVTFMIMGASGAYPIEPLHTVLFALGIFALIFFMVFLSYGLTHIFARLLGGTTSIKQLFAAGMAYAFAAWIIAIPVGVLSIIPFIGQLISFAWTIYTIIITIRVVREVYHFSTGRAVAAVLLPVAILFVIVFLLAALFAWFSIVGYVNVPLPS